MRRAPATFSSTVDRGLGVARRVIATGEMARLTLACLLALSALPACGSEPSVAFDGLADGDYVGGEPVTHVTVDEGLTVAGVELFVDNLRVGAVDAAPFDVAWSSKGFDDGTHTLRAHVKLAGGESADGSIQVRIDNTPPVIGPLPTMAVRDEPLTFDPTDNGALASITVMVGDHQVKRDRSLATVAWDQPCGLTRGELTVTDRAGNAARARFELTTLDGLDADCD